MKILMHMCCANCSLYPLKSLEGKRNNILGFWFNPNIQLEDEHTRRLDAMRTLESLWGLDVTYSPGYRTEDYNDAVAEHDGIRCEVCYQMRLMEAAAQARKMKADAFTTSLLVSPYQKHELIVEAGALAEKEHGIPFYYEDFREGFREGSAVSRELGLYRQNYCGCSYSKAEREAEREAKKLLRAAQRKE